MIVIILLIAVIAAWKIFNNPNAKAVRNLCKGKTADQKKVIEYFCLRGLLAKIKCMSDEEYRNMVKRRLEQSDFKKKALAKLGIDEDDVQEIKPISFEGYDYENAYAKKDTLGKWVSTKYQVTWLFFSADQLYAYTTYFNMDEEATKEKTFEYFYSDITSISSASDEDKAKLMDGSTQEITIEKLKVVVPGDSFWISINTSNGENDESSLQAVKQKIRESKKR